MSNIAPINPNQRIEILDVLRGFALLGIIFNNILYFSGYSFMPFDELRQLTNFQLDEKIYYFLDIVITSKFYTLFSILFAVGFFLQFNRNKNSNIDFLKIYRRRLLILLLIGLLHSLIWFGDILFMYALMGFILILFRNIRIKYLLWWSIFFLIFPVIIDIAILPFFHATGNTGVEYHTAVAHTNYPDMTATAVFETFRYGTVKEIFFLNIHNLMWKWLSYIPSGRLFITLGIFLLGYYLGAIGFFREKTKSKILLISTFIIGLLATISSKILDGNPFQFPPTLPNIIYKILVITGHILMCIFYITSIFMIIQTPVGKRTLKYLKPVGRMALTNYISQTVLLVIIFYNFGFNLFGRTGLITICGIAILVLVFQIIVSNIWLKYFQFGPLEWIWRCLTYKKRLKIRYEDN
jgi:uncharacterized protein